MPATVIVRVCYTGNWMAVIIAEFSTWKYISVVFYILCWSKLLEILYFMPTQTVDCGRITSSCTDERNCQQILLETFSTKVHSCGPSPFFNSVFIFLILLTTSSLYAPPPSSFSLSPSCRFSLFRDRSPIQSILLCNLKKQSFSLLACASGVIGLFK